MSEDLPGAVLFSCTMNAIRSPMAEAILKHLQGHRIFVDSAGARRGALDPFAVEVMEEIGITIGAHRPKSFEDLQDSYFDVIVALSPEAQHHAIEMTRTMACEVEFWNTMDPTIVEGSRDARLAAYRQVRDTLMKRILERFPTVKARDT